MKHGYQKIKIHSGKDSNRMILRKLLSNFFINSHIVTTEKKGKILKTAVDALVSKLKQDKPANRNVVLSYIGDTKLVKHLFDKVGNQVSSINGGFVRLIKLGQRENDGSMMTKLEWAHPVVNDYKKVTNAIAPAKVKKVKVANEKAEVNNEIKK